MSKIIRNSRVVSQTGYYKDLVSKPSINGHILEEIGNTSKNLDIFVTIPKADYEDEAFEPNVQAVYAVIDDEGDFRIHFFNQNPDAPVEYILHDYREVDELPEVGDETVLYYVRKSYKDEDTGTVYRTGLWGWICINPEETEEEKEYEWRSFTDTKVDDLTIHNYESLSTQVGGYIKDSFETEDVIVVNALKPTNVENDGTNTTLHVGWSDYNPYTPNTKYTVKVKYQIGSGVPIIKEGEITPHGTLPDLRIHDVGTVILQKPENTLVLDGTIFTSEDVEDYRVTITWAKPKETFISRINPLFIPHDNTIKVNEEGKLSVGGNSNAYAAINRVGDYLYDTYYSGLDYGYAEQYFKNKNSTAGFCSLMRSGNLIGRNYDMVYSELCDFIVHTPNRTGRFATVGVASGLKELTRETVESGKNSDDYKILPFQLVDGMNEKGVFAAYNMVPTDKALTTLTVPDIMEKKVMCALQLVRFVVDNFETALEAVEYIRDYVGVYMTDEMQDKGYEVHLMVMDKDDSYIIEFIDNKNIVQNVAAGTYMTNFYQTDAIVNFDRTVYTPEDAPTHLPSADNNITEHGSGLERYNIMANAYNPITPFTSKTEMWDLMNQLKYTNTYTGLNGSAPWGSEFVGIGGITVDTPIADIQTNSDVLDVISKFNNRSRDPEDPNYGTWHTMHSCVYDVVNLAINVASQEGSEEYTYTLPKTSAEDNEIRLSEISDETIDTSQNATLQLILDGIFNENKTFIINYNDEEKILTNSTPMRDDHGVYLPFSGSPHGDYTLLRVYYDVPTKLVMGCKRYQMLPVMYSLMDIAEGSPLATNCIVAVCDDFRKVTFSAPNPFRIGLKDGWKGDGTVQYSFNKQDWFDWDGVTPIVARQNVYDVYEVHFRGVNNTYLWQDDENYTAFSIDADMNDVRVKGNVVYMLDYETDVPATLDHIFQGLFSGGGIDNPDSGLSDAENLTLPFTSLGDYSYKYMFENCKHLTIGPQIPAIEAKTESCMGMFKGCEALVECPTLPATVLGDRCYAEMFMGCSTITEAPVLAAQILKEECYKDMFNSCSSLEACPTLPAVMFPIPKGAYKGMFQDCTGITSMPVLEATMLEESAYENMFHGCTSLVTALTKLPAMGLAKYCYKNMFSKCDALKKMPQLPAKITQPYCYEEMFAECAVLEELSTLPIDTTTEGCCMKMFYGCPSIKTPMDLPAKKLAKYCYKQMFQDCVGITWLPSGKVYKVPSIGKATSSQISAGWNTDMFRGTTVYCDDEEAPIPITANQYYYTIPEDYLTFSCMNAYGTTQVRSTLPTGDKSGKFCYSTDKINWRPFVGGDSVTVQDGLIYFCGRITEVKETYGLASDYSVAVSGDIKCMSSISPEIWEISQPEVNYAGLFNGMTNLSFAENLRLINEYTSDYMYQNLFKGTKLVYGPATIPTVTNVAAHAYENMYYGCYQLVKPPVMAFPEVDVLEYGYARMFFNCRALSRVPADIFYGTLDPDFSGHAYEEMFCGCDNIQYSANFTSDFRTAPYCCSGMYANSGVKTVANNIWNVDTIEQHAYDSMYTGTKVTNIGSTSKIIINEVKDYGCTSMFKGCDELICDKAEDSVEIEFVNLGQFAFYQMFAASNKIKACPIIFSKDSDTMGISCCDGMYRQCDSLRYLPKLYPTILKQRCYESMFQSCPKIVWAKFGSKWRVPWEQDATSVGSNAVLAMFKGTTAISPEDYGIPGSEEGGTEAGTPQIFKYYYYGDPSEWVTFTSDKPFTTHLTPQYTCYNETTEEWDYSTTVRDVDAYLVDGIYILKVAGFHTKVITTIPTRNDNPITMIGEGWVKAKGKIAALMGHDETNGSYIFMGNTILRDITELDLVTPLEGENNDAPAPVGFKLESLFQGCTGLVDEGVTTEFPLTILVENNCKYMFRECTGLTKAYDFSNSGDIELKPYCFMGMYYGCTNITAVPLLPWTEAASYCYAYMFYKCTNLTQFDSLPLLVGAKYCCTYMVGYTGIVNIDPQLLKISSANAETAEGSYYGMFYHCDNFVTTLDLSSWPEDVDLPKYMFAYMFGYTKIITPPYLPWKKLGHSCYYAMFISCQEMTKYATGKADDADDKRYLPAIVLKPYCYYKMYELCTKLTTPWRYYIGGEEAHHKHGTSSWYTRTIDYSGADYCFGYMFKDTKITTIPQLEVFNVKTTKEAREVEVPNGMFYYTFSGCESLTSSNLIFYGYDSDDTSTYGYLKHASTRMFQSTFTDCTNLKSFLLSLGYLQSIGDYACYGTYRGCTKLNPRTMCTELVAVTSVGIYGCSSMFENCSKLTRPLYWFGNGSSKPTIGDYGCYYMYRGCNIKFNELGGKFYVTSGSSLGTNALTGMFNGFKTTGYGGNTPDINGTVTMATTYYFADCPINVTYYNSHPVTLYLGQYYYYSQDNGDTWTRKSGTLTIYGGNTTQFYASGAAVPCTIKQTASTPISTMTGNLSGYIAGLALSYVYGNSAAESVAVFAAKFANSNGITNASGLNLITYTSRNTYYNNYSAGGYIPPKIVGYPQMFLGCEYLKTAPSNLSYYIGHYVSDAYYFNYTNYGIFSEMFYGCALLTTGPQSFGGVKNSIENGNAYVGYQMFNKTFYNCNNLTSIGYIGGSSTDFIKCNYLNTSIFDNAFYNCYAMSKNPIPYLKFESNGGDMPDRCLAYAFFDCYALPAPTRLERVDTTTTKIYGRDSSMYATYQYAKVADVIYLPYDYQKCCCYYTLRSANYSETSAKGVSTVFRTGGSNIGSKEKSYRYIMHGAKFTCYTAYYFLLGIKNTGSYITANGTESFRYAMSGITGGGSGTPVSNTITIVAANADAVYRMFNFPTYGTWSPMNSEGTPTVSSSGITFKFSY